MATGYAKMKNRLGALACSSSIGPGATNMITGAATATVNRLPVLCLPSDIFASRRTGPVLQQLESNFSGTTSANDAFKAALLLGSDQPARPAAHRPPGGNAHPDQPGRHRRRRPRPPTGCAGRSLGLPDRAVPGAHLARAAGPKPTAARCAAPPS